MTARRDRRHRLARNLVRRTVKQYGYDPDAVAWPEFRVWAFSWAALLRRDRRLAFAIWYDWEIEMGWVG